MQNSADVAMCMPMFVGEPCDLAMMVADIQHHWGVQVDDYDAGGEVATMRIDGAMVAVMLMPAPIPAEELAPLYGYAYLWQDVEQDVARHTHHAIVSVMGASSPVHAHRLMTMVAASALRSCPQALGVYQGGATLLLPKGLYCDFADYLLSDGLPVILWVYVGFVHHGDTTSIYTYGLRHFGRMELEIIGSTMPPNELHEFVLSVLAYLLDYDVYLQDGESIGFSADHKIGVSQSDGVHLDGQTLKLAL